MILYRENDFFHRHIQTFRCRLNDAYVGLVRNQPVKFILRDAGLFENFGRNIAQSLDGYFEDLITGHHDRRFIGTCCVQIFRHTDRVIQQVFVLAIGTEMGCQNSRPVSRRDDDSASPIPK